MPRPAGYAQYPNLRSISVSDEQDAAIRALQAASPRPLSYSAVVRELIDKGLLQQDA